MHQKSSCFFNTMWMAETCLVALPPSLTTMVFTKSVVIFCLMSGLLSMSLRAMSTALGMLAYIPWMIIVLMLIYPIITLFLGSSERV